MKLGFYGSSLLSSYWNGAATYYRGLIRALHGRGHSVTFFEPRAYQRQENADIEPPDWCEVVVFEPDAAGLADVLAQARRFDVVVKTSGVGVLDTELLQGVHRRGGAGGAARVPRRRCAGDAGRDRARRRRTRCAACCPSSTSC